jgi:hypothetical protein
VDTYIRTNGKWAKISGQRGMWHVALGWGGNIKATYVYTYPTKVGALIAGKNWCAD